MERFAGFIVVLIFVGVAVRVLRQTWPREVIFEHQRGLLYHNGQFRRVLPPGAYRLRAPTYTINTLDLRPVMLTISGQEVLSADTITIKASLVAQYAISDPLAATQSSQSYHEALYAALQVALREVIATRSLETLLAERAALGVAMQALVAPSAAALGLNLLAVQLKDFGLPADLKRAYAQVVTAQKDGLAALERARGESAALRNLANTARLLDDHPSLLQLRALVALGAQPGNSVVFNVPPPTPPRADEPR